MSEIQLANGHSILLDDADLHWASQYTWRVIGKGGCNYACRYGPRVHGKREHYAMHRELLGLTDRGIHVDHIDGNGLNNQRGNLRIANQSLNQANARRHPKSGYKGVTRDPNSGRWRARIRRGATKLHLGMFDTAEEAAMAHDAKAREWFGEFARLSLPLQEDA